jgi:EmrB/QacA subfamily drug resistance transporter
LKLNIRGDGAVSILALKMYYLEGLSNMTNKTAALISASLAVFFVTLTSSGLNVALPSIGREFGSDAILLSWIVSSFVLAAAVFSLPFGRVGDIVGLKRIFLYGMLVFTLTSIIAMFSSSTLMLIIFRALQGVGAAMIAVTSTAMVTAIFPAKERGRALGLNIACVYAGSAAGPFLGGILTEHAGWRSVFALNIPVGVAVVALLILAVKGEWQECKGEKFDYPGSFILGAALIMLMYGFSLSPGIAGTVLVLLGLLSAGIFLKWEGRSTSPLIDVAIFRQSRPFVFSNLAALVGYTVIFSISFLISLYLQYLKGFSPEQAGLILVSQPVMQAVLSPFTGRLSDKIEPRIVASLGMALIFVGLLLFALLSDGSPLYRVIITLLILGTGFALFSSPNANAIMSSVTPRYFGVASAVMGAGRGIGQMLSMGITMTVVAIVVGRVAITPEYYAVFLTSLKIAFGIFSGLCLFGILASLVRGRVKP